MGLILTMSTNTSLWILSVIERILAFKKEFFTRLSVNSTLNRKWQGAEKRNYPNIPFGTECLSQILAPDRREKIGDTWHWCLYCILIESLKMLHYMPSKNLEHQNNVKKQTHTIYILSVTRLVVIYYIHTAVSNLAVLHFVSFSSTRCIGLLYLLVAVAGQYQDYHRHRLHALMSKNPHLDDLHLLLCQLEFLQQRHYRSVHTRRKKSILGMVFYSVYNWIYHIKFLLHLTFKLSRWCTIVKLLCL